MDRRQLLTAIVPLAGLTLPGTPTMDNIGSLLSKAVRNNPKAAYVIFVDARAFDINALDELNIPELVGTPVISVYGLPDIIRIYKLT